MSSPRCQGTGYVTTPEAKVVGTTWSNPCPGCPDCQDHPTREQLIAWLGECYRLSGADPDGNEDWRLAPEAVQEVARLRAELDKEQSALSFVNDLVDHEPYAVGQLAERVRKAEAELERWQTCSMCGEKMEQPGHCSQGESEMVKGLHQEIDQVLDQRDRFCGVLREAWPLGTMGHELK